MNRTTLLQDRRVLKFEGAVEAVALWGVVGRRGGRVSGLFGTTVPPLPTAL